MKTTLLLERFSKGKLLERRELQSRSWVQGIFELLYLTHAQIMLAAPRSITDIIGAARNVDSQSADGVGSTHREKATFFLAAPSGGAAIFLPTGSYSTAPPEEAMSMRPPHFLRGEHIGIQVGTDDTVVAPNDTRLGQKIFHGVSGTIAGPQVFDGYTVGDTLDDTIYGTREYGTIFTSTRGYRMASAKLLIYRLGNPGNLVMNLRAVDSVTSTTYFVPGATILGSGTTDGDTLPIASPYEWREITLAVPVDIHPGIIYFLGLTAPTGIATDSVKWRRATLGVGDYHPRYGQVYTTDGLSWNSTFYYIPMFDILGSAAAELEYGGCDIFGLTIADPDGEFSIRRLFTNNSGEAITVKESGIHAAVTKYVGGGDHPYFQGQAYAICVARDVLGAPVVVADTEVLQVTYTPQITV